MTELRIHDLIGAFHRGSTEVLGHYTPGGKTVIFNPLQTGDPFALGTYVHESIHRYLTLNSYYGVFLQALFLFAQHGMFGQQLEMAMDAARATHEGIATWAELAVVADENPAAFEESIARLPSAADGAPYLEWLDAVRSIIAIEPGRGCQDNKTALVLSLGLCAHAGDILDYDPTEWEDLDAFGAYLGRESPDVRLRNSLVAIEGSDVLLDCLKRLEALPHDSSDAGNRARFEIVVDLHQVFDLAPLHNAQKMKATIQMFAERCAAVAARAGLAIDFSTLVPKEFFGKQEPPEIQYVRDWDERYPHAVAGEGLTVDDLRARVQYAAATGLGLILAIAMYKTEHVHVGTEFYLADDEGNVTSAEESLKLLESLPVLQGELPTEKVMAILEESPDFHATYFFIRKSWRVWDHVLAGRERGFPSKRHGLRPFECAVEVEITHSGVESLVEFRGIGRARRIAAFSVSVEQQQYAAFFYDPATPRTYSLQAVPGEFGLNILGSMVADWGFEQTAVDPIGNDFELLRLLGHSFLL